ncbi:IclR family transcriptional regulator [Dactylosporangium sp. AC04546]|uniref:IclR family transcriptional regulator n=1 Tax=Dactylosporangium sp. AC04546 TaxID=2862460 RepID=UPI001EDDD28E|nr:IclR family transcriptional regulator [Dactylosporangium sp. AC04546]WVK79522.1 IclR family transcriptional regulator [Dactylosporangium sp. AC04546]
MAPPDARVPAPVGGVQSIDRVFTLLEQMADAGGIAGASRLARSSGLPVPTIHRLLRTLVAVGYARQEPSREYALGPRLVRLGEAAGRLLEGWARPCLERLATALGESVNFAQIEGTEVIYVAQAPGRHSMRMFTEVGHRAGLHCTAVGKAILSTYAPPQAAAILQRAALERHTDRTITAIPALQRQLDVARARGFAVDLGEQEVGVHCVAVALPGSPSRGAVSVSGPQARMTPELVSQAIPLLRNTARELYREMDPQHR